MFTKKEIVSLILVICIGCNAFAAKELGQLPTLTVSAEKTLETKETDREELEKKHYQSVADVLKDDVNVSFTSYGGLGSLQSPRVRGLGQGRTKVLFNGVRLDNDYDTAYCFDLSSIAFDAVDSVTVNTTGAVGGVIDIKSKKPEKGGSLIVENGSLLGNVFDSQKAFLSYSTDRLIGSFTFQRAENSYRKNAAMYSFAVTADYEQENMSSSNAFFYQHAGMPGSITWPSSEDYQNQISFNSVDKFTLGENQLDVSYSYSSFSGENYGSFKFETNSINVNFQRSFFYFNNNIQTMKNEKFDPSFRLRYFPLLGVQSDFYVGDFTFYLMAQSGYATDMKKFVPEASVGAEYYATDYSTFGVYGSYAKKLPSFSDMFYPNDGFSAGNPDLKPEYSLAGNLVYSFEKDKIKATVSGFIKYLNNAIKWSFDENFYTPENIEKLFYGGWEADFTYKGKAFDFNFGWMWNKLEDHTVKASVGYKYKQLDFGFGINYQNKALLGSASVDYHISEAVSLYLKIDNLFNTDYCLTEGYPMPGITFRTGGKWSF